MVTIDVAVRAGALLGECPLWSPEESVLYWEDIDGRLVHRYDPETGIDETRSIPGRPGSMVRTGQAGRLLIAAENELVWFDWESGTVTPWVTLETPGTGNRLNDGRTDPAGRYWVGSMYEVAADRRFTGQLYRIEGDGSFSVIRREVGVPNALSFDPERDRMYFADSLHSTIWAYDYDLDTGTARNETVFTEFSGLPGRPDGACVDSEGCLWVAAVHGGAVLRFAPDGRLDRRIDVPVTKPTMTAFGGRDLGTLFVTSIGGGGSHPPTGQPGDGDLLAIDAGATGVPDAPFASA
ncbi:SMP-30/gluconolactonase/LRE family protein [Candidatus Spongiisocius sp.]|uniref:SMP-30/gluconolactonase/LRE family protein n=1 Tax=Candidatus Spongiisocius sp. TaxID=3101273 RepID=UPI003B5A84C3